MRVNKIAFSHFLGFTEVLTFSLCSRKENFDYLNVVDDNICVTIDNPQNQSFQVCRTSLYPGLMKTFKNSKKVYHHHHLSSSFL